MNSIATNVAPTDRPAWRILGILSLLMGFASISTDLYLPAMPAIAHTLGVSNGVIAWTISGYLLGFSLTQLVWGPLSDRYGRRGPIAIGLVLFIIGSAGCGLATTAGMMIGWRLVQAVGACACVALSRAMVRDLYEGQRAAQMMSTLITVMAIAPLIGPFLGGQIQAIAGWRAIFASLVVIGLFAVACLRALPETLPVGRRNEEALGRAFRRYGDLIRNKRLLGYIGVGGFFYGGTFAYIAGTPFAYIDYYGVPADLYGLLFGAGVVGIMATNTLNARFVPRFGADRLLVLGACAAGVCALLAAINAYTGWGGLAGLAVPLFGYASMTGLIVANAIAGALEDFPQRAGAVSALVGATQYGSGVFGSALVGLLANGTPEPLGLIVLLAAVGCVVSALYIARSDARRRAASAAWGRHV